jgi:hypothetical protein
MRKVENNGEPGGNRTRDHRIKSAIKLPSQSARRGKYYSFRRSLRTGTHRIPPFWAQTRAQTNWSLCERLIPKTIPTEPSNLKRVVVRLFVSLRKPVRFKFSLIVSQTNFLSAHSSAGTTGPTIHTALNICANNWPPSVGECVSESCPSGLALT